MIETKQKIRQNKKNDFLDKNNKFQKNNYFFEKENCEIFLKKIPNKSMDLILIDPPYFKKMVKDWKSNVINWDNQWKNIEEYIKWCSIWIKECKRILKDSGSFFLFKKCNILS